MTKVSGLLVKVAIKKAINHLILVVESISLGD